MSVNIYTEDGLKRIAGNGGGAEVDSELSETSENPVQNKIITEELNNIKKSVGDGKRDVANAITAKGIPTATDASFAALVDNIDKIVTLMQGTQDADVAAGDILFGKYCYAKGTKLMGTMPIRGAINQSLAPNGTYTIPQGYHNGSGKVVQNLETRAAQTYTPGTANQTIPAGRFLTGAQTILGDANLIPGNIAKGKSIFGVAGTFAGGSNQFIKQLNITNNTITREDILLPWHPSVIMMVLILYKSAGSPITNDTPPAATSITLSVNNRVPSNISNGDQFINIRPNGNDTATLYVYPTVSDNHYVKYNTVNNSVGKDLYVNPYFDSNMPSNIQKYAEYDLYLVALKF